MASKSSSSNRNRLHPRAQQEWRAKKRVSKLKSSAAVLQSLLQSGKSGLSQQFQWWTLLKQWPDVVGETIAAHSLPVGYKAGVLYVWVHNSVWLQQLVFMVDPIRKKINEHVGRNWVKRIRLTLDRKELPESLLDPSD